MSRGDITTRVQIWPAYEVAARMRFDPMFQGCGATVEDLGEDERRAAYSRDLNARGESAARV